MSGLMADFDADLARPFGVATTSGQRGALILDTGYLTTSGSQVVPVGATVCEVIAVAGGGGGAGTNGTQSQTIGGDGGAGAAVRSTFAVVGGSVSHVIGAAGVAGSTTSAGGVGSSTSVSYGGSVVARADPGLGGSTPADTSQAIGAEGRGGLALNCIGNAAIFPGQPGSALTYGGGSAALVTSLGGASQGYHSQAFGSPNSAVAGNTGTGYGAGGSGGSTSGGGVNGAGAAGCPGVVIYRFYAS